MSWDNSGDAGGSAWDTGATRNAFNDNLTSSAFDDAGPSPFGDAGTGVAESADPGFDAGGNDGGCFNCGQQGHMKSECPNPRAPGQNSGACYNCGETGHNKADCTNAAVAREFSGACRLCEKEGHRAAECPNGPARFCKNCGQEGHSNISCKNARKLDREAVPDVMSSDAWTELENASAANDLDDIKSAVEKYVKSIPETTYVELEKAFRNQNLNVYLIAAEREIACTYTNMNLQGELDRKYTVSYRLSDKPKRPKEAEGWPASAEENLERLKDAGEPVDRGVPKCGNCEQLGHTSKFCPEERQENTDRASVKCYNCDEVGHRVRDCPNPRPDRFACRNCKQSGHTSKECPEPRSAEDVECKKCGETGHFARDCPTGGGGGNECRNCGQEGHRAKECTEPRNPATMTCRNCDETGHMSKECPKPRDYSRVKCSNCQQMGHTKVRCKEPLVEEVGGNTGYDNGVQGGAGFGDATETANNFGESTPSAGDSSWDTAAAASSGW